MTRAIEITDPEVGAAPEGWRGRICRKVLRDERDYPFLRLLFSISLTLVPAAIAMFAADSITPLVAALYLVVTLLYFLPPYILMLHNVSHRAAFKKGFGWIGWYMNWLLGPLFGETPHTYYAHHIGMHHPENNLEHDLSCTMRYQRDSFFDFMRYFLRFFFGVVVELSLYLKRRARAKLFWNVVRGEAIYVLAVVALGFLNWQATLVVFIIPLVFTRFAMMTGNWAQHAFIDPTAPDNLYRSSITCINSLYNRRCFNDGYHIGHHLKPNRHWSEMPDDLRRNRDMYAREGAIVFEKLDYFAIWALLMLRAHKTLARFVVDLGESPRSRDAIAAMLRERVMPIG